MARESKSKNKRSRGQAMLEFLAAIVCLFVTILWTVQLIIMIYTYVVLAAAAKEGVRYAVVHGSSNASGSQSGPASGSSSDCATNITAVETAVQRAANYPGMTVTVCYLDGNNKPPNRVSVNVSYPMTGLFTLGWSPPTVKAAAQGRITF